MESRRNGPQLSSRHDDDDDDDDDYRLSAPLIMPHYCFTVLLFVALLRRIK